MAVKLPVERLLCCNVLTSDEFSQPNVFRHPFYTYDGPITWPPPHWQQGRCLYCAHPFDGMGENGERIPVPPVPLPCFHDKRTGQWRVSGMYCSWNCAKADLLHSQGYACGDGSVLIEQLARKVFKYEGPSITPAPPKARLSFFYPGTDTLSIDEFRKDSAVSFTTIVSPPLLSSPEVYERHAIPASASPWTVKGIRAKGVSSSAGALAKNVHEPELDGEEKSCMFASFMRQKDTETDKRSEADLSPSQLECPAGGTLMDWREQKPAAPASARSRRRTDS